LSISPSGNLIIWHVYRSPRDYPGKWVLRGQEITQGGEILTHPSPAVVANTLEQARSGVPIGDTRMPRHPDDDPALYETWM
jgi:hypothetical protein